MANLSKIGRGTTIVGNIRGDGDLDIEGRVEGSLDIDGDVTLSEGARIKSPIRGTRVVVRGAVAGDITARDAIVLEEGARVVGDLSAPSIGIRPGGLLRGYVSTDASAKKPARAEQRASSPRETAAPRESQPGRTTSQRTTPRAQPPVERKETVERKEAPKEERREPVQRLVEPAPSPLTKPAVAEKAHRGAPAPVMPALQKGAKGALKKKGAR